MSKSETQKDTSAAENIDRLIAGLTDWRGKIFAGIRKTILEADGEITEEWKWMGSPVWSRDGILLVGNAHKEKVKLTFSHGASLPDPDKLFNNGFGGKVWRAIDVFEGDSIDARALKNLIRAAIEFNQIKLKTKAVAKKSAPKKATEKSTKKAAVKKKAPGSARAKVSKSKKT